MGSVWGYYADADAVNFLDHETHPPHHQMDRVGLAEAIDRIGFEALKYLPESKAASAVESFVTLHQKKRRLQAAMCAPTTASVYVALAEVLKNRYPTVTATETGKCMEYVATHKIQEEFNDGRSAEMIHKLELLFKHCVRESRQPYHDALRVSFKLLGHEAELPEHDTKTLWGEAIVTCVDDSTEFIVLVRGLRSFDSVPAELPVDEIHLKDYTLAPARDALKFFPQKK